MEIEEENESDEEMESEDDNEIISEFEEGKINQSFLRFKDDDNKKKKKK